MVQNLVQTLLAARLLCLSPRPADADRARLLRKRLAKLDR